VTALDSKDDKIDGPLGVFIDDATNHPTNADGSPTKSTTLRDPLAAEIFKATGDEAPPPTSMPNLIQQSYFLSATTKVLIPHLKDSGKPFVLLFWSRDPDATQHGALDSDGRLVPGINSASGRAAIANADNDLKGILDALKQWGMADDTDVFVTADHGFSTIAKGIPAPDRTVQPTSLPGGFLANDVAGWLGGKVFGASIGHSPDAPLAIVAANGGSDFIYVPAGRATAKRIFDKLLEAPYLGALFVNDELLKSDPKDFAGALPMTEINLIGSSNVPRPAFVVGFRSFVVQGCTLGEQMCTAEIADTGLHTGQGMHGSFSRADTRNFMAAIGPDFKTKFVDKAPVGNADVAPTLAHILGVDLTGPGTLKGRVIVEALKGGKPPKATRRVVASAKAANGVQTILNEQQVGLTRYFDAAGIPGRTVGLSPK
jgi:arylsulfatase A-like enzyme